MKFYFLFFVAILLSTCKEDNSACCTTLDIGIDLSVKSSDGIDLLDQDQNDAIQVNQIELYYYDQEYNSISNNLISNFDYLEKESDFVVRIYAVEVPSQTIIVQWDESDSDTLECELYISNNSSIINKVKLNKEVVWKTGDGERHLELIK